MHVFVSGASSFAGKYNFVSFYFCKCIYDTQMSDMVDCKCVLSMLLFCNAKRQYLLTCKVDTAFCLCTATGMRLFISCLFNGKLINCSAGYSMFNYLLPFHMGYIYYLLAGWWSETFSRFPYVSFCLVIPLVCEIFQSVSSRV